MIRLFLIFAVPCALLLYSGGLQAPFYLDDLNVLQNAQLRLGPRALGFASFWLNDQINAIISPALPWKAFFYYRFFNVLIHAMAATALFWLARELRARWSIAATAGILFLVHPVQTQAVTYISQRFESQATLFMLISAAAYARFRNRHSQVWLAAAVLSGVAAGFTKETAVILTVWILMIEAVFFEWREVRKRAVPLAVLTAALAIPALQAFWGSGNTLTWIPWTQYFFSQGAVLSKYLQLIVWPSQLFLFYDFPPVEAVSPQVLLQWALVLAFAVSGVLAFRWDRLVGFGIATFLLMLLPVTLLPLPDLVFEHRLYPAMAGIALAAGAALQRLNPRARVLLLVLVLLPLSVRTFRRNSDWLDPVRFMEMHRERFPTEPIILTNLSGHYATRGLINEALAASLDARKFEGRANAYYKNHVATVTAVNLGFQYLQANRIDEAEAESERALKLDADDTGALWMTGSVRLARKDFAGAADTYKKLAGLDPWSFNAWTMLGHALNESGDAEGVEIVRKRAAEIQRVSAELRPSRPPLRDGYRTMITYGMVVALLSLLTWAVLTVWRALNSSTSLVAHLLRRPRSS